MNFNQLKHADKWQHVDSARHSFRWYTSGDKGTYQLLFFFRHLAYRSGHTVVSANAALLVSTMPVLPFEALPAPRQTSWGSTASTMPALEVRWQCWRGAAPVVNFRLGCKLLFEYKLSWILYQLIYFHDNKKNCFFDNLCIIIKLITLFICHEYKAIIKELIITPHHILIVTFSKKQIVIEH